MTSKQSIYWRCRRGMLELDLFIMPFFEACYDDLTPALQADFVELLSCPDPDILSWLMGHRPADAPFEAIVSAMRAFKYRDFPAE